MHVLICTNKGYAIVGATADWTDVLNLLQDSLYCARTKVPLAFDKSSPSLEPFVASANRILGSVGPRHKAHTKHLHYLANLEVVCRALNLAQRNFSADVIMEWVRWIQSNPFDDI